MIVLGKTIAEEDSKPSLVILLEGNLSDFFSNVAYLESLNDKVSTLLESATDLKSYLEKQKVNYIVLSSHMSSLSPPGLGIFGQTYCPVLYQYFHDHFELAATFGVWKKGLPKKEGNYGTKILKRRTEEIPNHQP